MKDRRLRIGVMRQFPNGNGDGVPDLRQVIKSEEGMPDTWIK